jgi:hypothetical protein
MNRYLEDARDEIQRVQHLIYVTLKYTRTVDVIKTIIERLIATFDLCIQGLLIIEHDLDEEADDTLPKSPGLRAKMLGEDYKDEPIILQFLEFYHLLRELKRAEFTRRQEYRRHVTMTAMLQNGPFEVNIDIITEYYRKTKEFVGLCEMIAIKGRESDIAQLLHKVQVNMEYEKF